MKKQKLVIIGNGMAGARMAEEILKRNRGLFDITMFGAEPYGNYNRILLSNVLNGSQTATEIFMNPLSWYKEQGITLHAGYKVARIDHDQKKVIAMPLDPHVPAYERSSTKRPDERALIVNYDFAIIATGSRPFIPPMVGFGTPGTFAFRTLDDCEKIASYAKNAQRAVVIGGGLLGLEAARGLMTHNVHVTVIEAAHQLMGAQLDEEGGQILQSTIEAMGMRVILGEITEQIISDGHGVTGIRLKNGQVLDCDMVVVSTGIRPITDVAEDSGLAIKKGILVDDQLRTEDPQIFAVGECIEHRGRTYGLVDPIWEQINCIADIITEKNPKAQYLGSKLGTKLKVMGVELASFGDTKPTNERDEVILYREPRKGIYQKLIIRKRLLAGGILMGNTEPFSQLMSIFKEEIPVPKTRTELLFGASNVAALHDVEGLPDSAQICNCNGVSKGDIRDAILNQGCTSVSQVGECNKAGKGCGSCKTMILQLIEAYAGKVGYDTSEHYYVPGIPMEKSELIAAIKARGLKSVSSVFEALGNGHEHAPSKVGLASLLRAIWNEQYDDERDARFINDRVHANIQRDGTFSVVPRIYGGVTTADELIRIGQVAKKYHVPMVKITGGQRIDLLGVSRENLPKIWQELGIPSGHAYTKAVRTVKSCVGTDFCRYGLGDSIKLAQDLERVLQGIETPHKVKMAVTGCPRNCAEAYVKDVGVVAIEGGLWEIYIGGAAGSTVRKGDLLATVDNPEVVIQMTGRFLQYYREHAKYMERTYGFCERIGIERLKAILIKDELNIAEKLDAEMAKAIASYQDPWMVEAKKPAHPSQFKGPELATILEEAVTNG